MSCTPSKKGGCCGGKAACQPQPEQQKSCCSSVPTAKSADTVHAEVKEYYGKRVKSGDDLQTDVCLLGKKMMPKHVRGALSMIHEEVQSKYYGCGLIAPEALEGCSILDLGSGAGMDCFVLSNLVGQEGHVTGLDMTDEQLEVANQYIEYHTKAFGYSTPNVNFVKGYIEQMVQAGLKESSFDVIVSNCVINLCPDKRPVLSDAFKVLKEGGELYFSDVYSDKTVPEEIRKNEILWGECIAGAMHWRELYQFAKEVGFSQPRLVEATEFHFKEDSWKALLEGYSFLSANYRLFRLPAEAKDCPSMTATYKGGMVGCEESFTLDYKFIFQKGCPVPVPGDVAAILKYSRFQKYFDLEPAEKPVCKPCGLPDPFALAREGEIALKPSGCCS